MDKYKKFALGQYAEMEGYTLHKGEPKTCPDKYMWVKLHYRDPSKTYCSELPTIDHPFCHELVKGLDVEHEFLFMGHLKDLTTGVGAKVVAPMSLYEILAVFTATVDQILEAYWEALHED